MTPSQCLLTASQIWYTLCRAKLRSQPRSWLRCLCRGVAVAWIAKGDFVGQGSRFTGQFWTEVMRLVGTKQSMSTAFHPQTDGQTERANGILGDMLRAYVSPEQDNWDECLDAAEFAVNIAWQEAVRATPSELNFGHHPITPVSVLVEQNSRETVAKAFFNRIAQGIQCARACMEAAQQWYKH
jgi:transposase InsO family protein